MTMAGRQFLLPQVLVRWRLIARTAAVLLCLSAAAELLIWRLGGLSAALPDALLWRQGWPSQAAQAFSLALDVLLPMSSLLPLLVLEQDLLRRRRALFATYPDASVQRPLGLLTLLSACGILAALMAAGVPALLGAPVNPLMAVLATLPTLVALTGASFLAAEWTRHPATGLLFGLLWATGSLLFQYLARPVHPVPLAVLFAASRYPLGPWLFFNRLLTLATGLALWALGGAAQQWNRRRGLDV